MRRVEWWWRKNKQIQSWFLHAVVVMTQQGILGNFIRRPTNGHGRCVTEHPWYNSSPESRQSFLPGNAHGGFHNRLVADLVDTFTIFLGYGSQTSGCQLLRLETCFDAIKRCRQGGRRQATHGRSGHNGLPCWDFGGLPGLFTKFMSRNHNHSVGNIWNESNWEGSV